MRPFNVCLLAAIACSACDMVDVYQRQIDQASHAIESASTDAARAAAYADRGRGRSDKARLSFVRNRIDRDEYVRLFTLAIEDHDRAVALASGDAQIYVLRGLTHYDRAALVEGVDPDRNPWFDAARSDFAAAVERNPSHVTAYDYRGLVDEQTDRFEEAVADYTHVMTLDPRLGKSRLSELYCNHGQAQAKNEHFDVAAVELEKSVALGASGDGCSCEPYNSLAYVYIEGTGQYDKARDLARRARASGHAIAPEYLEKLDRLRASARP